MIKFLRKRSESKDDTLSKGQEIAMPALVSMTMRHYRESGRRFREGADEAILKAAQSAAHEGKSAVIKAMAAEIERQEVSLCLCGHWH